MDSSTASQINSGTTSLVSTPLTSGSASVPVEEGFRDLKRYIALGCLHYGHPIPIETNSTLPVPGWIELLFASLPDEAKLIIGEEVTRLLHAEWIRLFLYRQEHDFTHTLVRVYVLPEDWGRRFIDRKRQSLKLSLRQLLPRIDVSPEAWFGDSTSTPCYFDPWATSEVVSLFYLFNKLPSPAPLPEKIKDRYTRLAVEELLDSTYALSSNDVEEQPLDGLKTKLYPYQARSASLMIQRESAPQLQLDPRLETRHSPTGETYYFGARDGSFLQEPRYYEVNRGGILAETMVSAVFDCCSITLIVPGTG